MKPWLPFTAAYSALLIFNLTSWAATTRYVDLNCTNPVSPYSTWATAATNIQLAANAAVSGDLVLVTNGIYQTGGSAATARVVITPPITVQSVNGAAVTTINGAGVMRCALLSSGAKLLGFTLANGAAGMTNGGGVYCLAADAFAANCIFTNNSAINGGGAQGGSFSNCTFIANVATNDGGGVSGFALAYFPTVYQSSFISNSAFDGGGAMFGILVNCSLTGNSATDSGGGAALCNLTNAMIMNNTASVGGGVATSTAHNSLFVGNESTNNVNNGVYYGGGAAAFGALNNCTVAGNFSRQAGAVANVVLNNCIIYYNSNNGYADCYQCQLTNCCTTLGTGNPDLPNNSISNAPSFVNPVGGDYHLQEFSSCINSGRNFSIQTGTDLDGNARIAGGTVDIGAYEFQTPGSIISYAYLQRYGLPLDGTADYLDSDGDGLNNWQEWKAETVPIDANSVLKLFSPTNSVSGMKVTWQSVSGVTYYLQRSINLPAFFSIKSNLVGQTISTSYTDATATNSGRFFYRVGVQ